MVMEYGMSRLGRINYRGASRSAFLSLTAGDDQSRTHSERTAREIDEEVKRIIDESIEKVRHIVETRRPALEALTRLLIEVESVDAEELQRIIEENSPGPLVVPGTAESRRTANNSAEKPSEGASERQG
jgi:cell division protease FtsH